MKVRQRRLLRNYGLESLTGLPIELGEAEVGGALPQSTKDTEAMLGIIGGRSLEMLATGPVIAFRYG